MVTVRYGGPADSAVVVRLLAQLGYERERDEVERDLRAFGPDDRVLVAVDDDERCVGLVTMTVRRQLHFGARVACVDALVVDESVRSRGVGAALLAAAITEAERAECRHVELHSNTRRTRAREFYERNGFVVTSNYFVRHLR